MVASVVGGDTHVLDRTSGWLVRVLVGEWASQIVIDADALHLVSGARGAVTSFALADGAKRPSSLVDEVHSIRRWSSATESGFVHARRLLPALTYDRTLEQLASFGLRRRLDAFDVRGTTVVAAYADGMRRAGPVRVFDCLTGKKRRASVEGHTAPVLTVCLDEAGLVTGGLDATLRAYDAGFDFVRSARLPGGDYARRVIVDPESPRVLHVVAPQAVLRLDRDTLEVIDRVPVESGYAAFHADAQGRFVGVGREVIALDVAPAKHTLRDGTEVPDVSASYERDGFFDKDAQGWCATYVTVQQHGARVSVRELYDENGSTRSQTTREGRIDRVEGDVVHLEMDSGPPLRFDLTTRTLSR